jgi:membrane-bound lytic murein transglycosylase D
MLLAGLLPVSAQDSNTVSLIDIVQAAHELAVENLQPEVVAALPAADARQTREFLAAIQKDFHGQYIVDLAPLRTTAKALMPLLETQDQTRPYARWLKPRLDYLDVADEWRLLVPPIEPQPGKTPPPIANPLPQRARDIWIKKLSSAPPPVETNRFVPELKPIFAQQKVPPALVWIAEVESAFDPRAVSPVGAAGLFQIMPETAKRFGLRTWPRDQRLDSKESARAAAQYLRILHRQFKDWRLALAAYNAGEGTIQRALTRHKARNFDAIARHLPVETQMYVPRVEAVLLRREGVKLSELPGS